MYVMVRGRSRWWGLCACVNPLRESIGQDDRGPAVPMEAAQLYLGRVVEGRGLSSCGVRLDGSEAVAIGCIWF